MNSRLFLIPVVFFGVTVVVALSAGSPDTRATFWGVSLGCTVSLFAAVAVFELLRSGARSARSDAHLSLASLVPAARPVDLHAEAAMALGHDDPEFSPTRVAAHVEALYRAMQQASRDGHLDGVHAWMSDGLYQRLSTQARLSGAIAGAELLDGHTLQAAVLCGAGLGATYQSMSVRVTVAPRAAGAGAPQHQAQTQTWQFLRRRAVKTRAQGLLEGRCPGCGAPLHFTATQRCAHCQAVVNSGEHDWVLCDTSPGATTLSRKPELLDPDGLRAKDPTLSPEELVDRALLAFWRWYEAAVGGDARRLTRVSTEAFRAELASTKLPRVSHEARVTVGGADLRMLRLVDGVERASALVWWSAGDGESQQTILELVRPSQPRAAQQGTGLASLRCEACLAPMTDAETPGCEHCGQPFTDAWRLNAIQPFGTWATELRAIRKQLGPQGGDWQTVPRHERLRALQLAAAVAAVDGRVTDAERALVGQLAATWGLTAEELEAAMQHRGPVNAAGLALPRDFARELVRQLVEVVFVDGRADLPERKLVERLGASLGIGEETQKLIGQRVDTLMKQLVR